MCYGGVCVYVLYVLYVITGMVSGKIAELLLSYEISLMPKDSSGLNALHYACIHNHVAIIDLLIKVIITLINPNKP